MILEIIYKIKQETEEGKLLNRIKNFIKNMTKEKLDEDQIIQGLLIFWWWL